MISAKFTTFAYPLAPIYEEDCVLRRADSLEVAAPQSPREACRPEDWAQDRQRECAALLGTTPEGLQRLRAALAPSSTRAAGRPQ